MDIVYGVNPIVEVIRAKRRRVLKLFVSDSKKLKALEERTGVGFNLVEFKDKKELYRICHSEHHQGMVAEVEDYPYVDIEEIFEMPQNLILCLDDIQDPQNVGSILRSAYCFGVSGVVLRSHHCAKITPSVVKASSGATEHLLISMVSNHKVLIERAREKNFLIFSLDVDGVPIHKEKIPFKRSLVLIVGSEDKGVKTSLKKCSDYVLKIPMKGDFNSLNVSAATSVALFEIMRRRG